MEKIYRLYKIIIAKKSTCIFHQATGMYCPGCGGSHALWALLNGHIIKSFLYHPIVLFFLVVFIYYIIKALICLIRQKAFTMNPLWTWISLAIVLGNWGIKNVMLFNGFDFIEIIGNI